MHDEEYPVLTQFKGTLDFAKIAELRPIKYGHSAVLAEPFGSKMGAFSYEALLQKGRAESQGYTVYTVDFWNSNRNAEIQKYMEQWFPKGAFEVAGDPNEINYRRLLGLPDTGALLKSEIEHSFRIRARSAHPDRGGSDEDFQKLGAAKEALLRNWQR